jgi:hypothetical protein
MSGGPAPPASPTPPPLPGWLGSAVQVTTQVGVPTVFAGVLLYFVLTSVVGTLEQMKKNDEDRMRMLAAMQDSLIGTLNNQTTTFERSLATQTDRFVAAVNANIATNQGIATSMERLVRARRSGKDDE